VAAGDLRSPLVHGDPDEARGREEGLDHRRTVSGGPRCSLSARERARSEGSPGTRVQMHPFSTSRERKRARTGPQRPEFET
jgi:hypothetical protein